VLAELADAASIRAAREGDIITMERRRGNNP
jgi:hypothetical protein